MSYTRPDFVSNYYKTSTFSFLSTNKAKLQKKAADRIKLSTNEKDLNTNDHEGSSPDSPENQKFVAFSDNSNSVILHIDMDCFYVSVSLKDQPHLWKLPVAVSPAGRQGGTSEIACCNYVARDFGIKSRMLVRDAMVLCPELLILTCEFEKYQKVSEKIFDIFFEVTNNVQPLSVDEALLDITNCGDPEEVAAKLRNEIFNRTGCTASAGIGHNIMLAKLATRQAKPNGQLYVQKEKVDTFLQTIPVQNLPGIGEAITEKLSTLGVKTIGQLSQIPMAALKENFGEKKGDTLYKNARGVDDRSVQVQHERKSIGTQISWGVRLADMDQAMKFLRDVSVEVVTRMKEVDGTAKRVTLRVKRHQDGMEEASKFLNPGHVVVSSKSSALTVPSKDQDVIIEATISTFKKMNIPPLEVRGIGLSVDLATPEEVKKKGGSQSVTAFFAKKTNTNTNTNFNTTTTTSNNNNNNSHNSTNNNTHFNNNNYNMNISPTNNPTPLPSKNNINNNVENHAPPVNNSINYGQTSSKPKNARKAEELSSTAKKQKTKQGNLLNFFQK